MPLMRSKAIFSSLVARYRLYIFMASTFFVLALGLMLGRVFFAGKRFDFLLSDAKGYYAYLPSVVIDGDLDFSNQIRNNGGEKGEAILERRTPKGYVKNKYSIGLALTLAPAFLTVHALCLTLHQLIDAALVTPNGYTPAYQILALFWIMTLGLVSMILLDRVIVDHLRLSPRSVALGITIYWAGSHYSYYYFVEPFMVHVVSNFWVVLVTVLARATSQHLDRDKSLTWPSATLGFAFAMAVLCRPTNLVFLAVVSLPFLTAMRSRKLRFFLRFTPLVVLSGAVPILLQLMVWRVMTGELVHYSYEGERFLWLEPALWQTLFSSKHGLFFWSPLLLFSMVGLFRHLAIRGDSSDLFLVCQAVSAVLLWYVNSCWQTWWFGDAFGGRAFLELSSLFIIGLSLFLEYSRQGGKLRVVTPALVCAVVYNYVLLTLYGFAAIPRGNYLF